MRSRLNIMLILILLITLLASCKGQEKAPIATEPIRLGHTPWVGWGAIYIANHEGLFTKEGITVEVVSYPGYNDLTADFATRKLDVATTVYADAIAQAAAGVALQLIWVFDSSNGGDVFVASSEIEDMADLKGKRIGLDYGTFSHLFVLEGLKAHNLTEADVQIVSITADRVPAAIAAGEIDAGHTWEPYLSEVVANGGHVLFDSADTPGVILDSLRVHTSIAERRAADVQKLVRAMVAAYEWWQQNPEAGNQIVAEEMGITAEEIPAILTGIDIYNVERNQAAFAAGEDALLQRTGELAVNLYLANGIIEQTLTVDQLLNAQFVNALAK